MLNMWGNRYVQGKNGIPSTIAKSNFILGILSKISLSANMLEQDLKFYLENQLEMCEREKIPGCIHTFEIKKWV